MSKRKEIRDGIREALVQYRYLELYHNPLEDKPDYLSVVTDALMNRLDSQGVAIKGVTLGISHPHLGAYFTMEPLIEEK